MNNFCKMFGLLQTELENPGNCFHTASASSPELTASVVSWTAYAMKNVYKPKKCKQMQKPLMHSRLLKWPWQRPN